MNDKLKYLSTYSMRIEAEGIKGLLESNGIKCFLQFDETGDALEGVGVDTGPTKIYVEAEQLEKAQEIANVKDVNIK